MAGKELNWDTANNRDAEAGMNAPRTSGVEGGSTATEPSWLRLAQVAYTASTEWLQANKRNRWENAYRSFNNVHPSGSKYFSDAFKHRSKLFRPKTRTAIRKAEAGAAAAFFATQDLVSVEARNDENEQDQAAAAVNEALLNYRLDGNPIKWFMHLQGAFQDTQVAGVCVSYQYWHYEERVTGYVYEAQINADTGEEEVDPETGQIILVATPQTEVVADEPRVQLIPPENFRIDPMADWLDPVQSSPYCIRLIPMYVVDVKTRMRRQDEKTGQPQWHEVDDQTLLQARDREYNSTKQAREEYRSEVQQQNSSIREYDTVWIHENIVRWDGQDYVYFTVGTSALLTDPTPIEEVYFHGERPYIMGYSLIEAHKPYPAGKASLVQDLQREANEVANQRLDNVRLAMNPRYFYRQGSNIDLAALQRSVPGGPVGLKNPQEDLQIDRPDDVTRSAYEEQDRINVDLDELSGNFSQGSVQTNRKMNETVGGMNLLSQSANLMQDYDLRVFSETWVEPVLRQLVKLEQAYETDETVLELAAKKGQIYQRYRYEAVTDEVLRTAVDVRVNVGIGNTDPAQRLERFRVGMDTVGNALGPSAQQQLNAEEVINEVFGILGYKNGARFFNWQETDPQYAQLAQRVQELEAQVDSQEAERQHKEKLEHIKGRYSLQEQQMQHRADFQQERMDNAADLAQTAMKTKQALTQEQISAMNRVREAMVQSGLRQYEQAQRAAQTERQEAMRAQQPQQAASNQQGR